jgi:hypothetical protein
MFLSLGITKARLGVARPVVSDPVLYFVCTVYAQKAWERINSAEKRNPFPFV